MRASPGTVAILLFGSGLAALVYQTAWQRMLRLVFGASTAASAAVIAIFLGGLGLGGAWLGKRAERTQKPLELYGTLEAGVAVCAALTPLLVLGAETLYFSLGGSARLGLGLATVIRVLLAVLVLGPAVVLMGGTLPAAARAVETGEDRSRGRLALLYATNTAGAVVGALLGTFLLFELFGTQMTLWIAALINLLVAVVARALGRDAPAVPLEPEPVPAAAGEGLDARGQRRERMLVYALACLAGFVFVALELIWYRVLSPLLGGSTFTFGLILAVALAGIGIGAWLYTRRPHDAPVTWQLLAATLALEGLFAAIPLALGDRLAIFAAYTRPMATLGFSALVVSWTLICAVAVLPASVVAGYQFPVLFGLLGRGRAQVARQVGLAYAFNTAGSIAGALLIGFVLIPRLGAIDTWRCIVVLLGASAALCVALALRVRPRPVLASVGSAVVVALALAAGAATGPTAAWRHSPIGAGRADVPTSDANTLRAWQHRRQAAILWEQDGVESSVALDNSNGVTFVVNGKSDGSVAGDKGTQGGFGLLAALLHPSPREAFVLGLGTGMTAGWIAAVPGMTRVDVAELEPAILKVARESEPVNAGVLKRKNVFVHLEDGREFLLSTGQQYDVILSEPSNPFRAGIASLFTREFYAAAAARLKPGGLFAQWLQGYEIDSETVRVVLRTLGEEFAHVELWHTQAGDLMLVASAAPLTHDVGRVRQRMMGSPYAEALARFWYVSDAEGVFSHFVGNAALVKALSDGPLNTDDSALLEYAFARNVGAHSFGAADRLFAASLKAGTDRPSVSGALNWQRVAELRPRAWLLTYQGGGLPPWIMDKASSHRQDAFRHGCAGRYTTALQDWRKQADQEPHDVLEQFILGAGLAREKDPRALELARVVGARGFTAEAELIRARFADSSGDAAAAGQATLRALAALRATALPVCNTVTDVLGLVRKLATRSRELQQPLIAALAAGPFSVYVGELTRHRELMTLAFANPDPQLCVKAMGKALTLPEWSREFLARRYECLRRADHPLADVAFDDLQSFLEREGGDFTP